VLWRRIPYRGLFNTYLLLSPLLPFDLTITAIPYTLLLAPSATPPRSHNSYCLQPTFLFFQPLRGMRMLLTLCCLTTLSSSTILKRRHHTLDSCLNFWHLSAIPDGKYHSFRQHCLLACTFSATLS